MQEYSQSVWRYRMQMIFQRFGDTFLGQIVVTGISLSEDFTDIFNLCVAVDIYRLLSDTAHHRKNMTVYETVLGIIAPFVGVLWFILAMAVFRQGLKRYTGGGG